MSGLATVRKSQGPARPVWAVLAGTVLLGALVSCGASTGGREAAPANPSAAPALPGAPVETAAPDAASENPGMPIQEPPGPPPTPRLATASTGVTCPAGGETVHDGDELALALLEAQPGQTINLADGTYRGTFAATTSGQENNPIFLCGGPRAVLNGGGIEGGYVLHLDGANWWRLVGFTVRNGQKGVVLDNAQQGVVQALTIDHIGDEAIHLRSASSDGLVIGNRISDTGLRRDKFGEGIYVGSSVNNWCRYTACRADRSDRNVIRNNTVTGNTAEAVDIKEGTTGGAVVDNTFQGSKLTGADSWVDVKGNGWLISGNTGQDSPVDGFQTHELADGWGTGNVFIGNFADLGGGSGWGIHLAPALSNKVACDNRATRARQGMTNVECAGPNSDDS